MIALCWLAAVVFTAAALAAVRSLAEYDGWALSTSSVALRSVLALCPDEVRLASWCKTWASFKKGVNPAYAWEPVIFYGGRSWKERGGQASVTIRDWHSCTVQQDGFFGAKPRTFCWWVFDLLGADPSEDEMVDLFPGSGAVARAWATYQRQGVLSLPDDVESVRLDLDGDAA